MPVTLEQVETELARVNQTRDQLIAQRQALNDQFRRNLTIPADGLTPRRTVQRAPTGAELQQLDQVQQQINELSRQAGALNAQRAALVQLPAPEPKASSAPAPVVMLEMWNTDP